jgi:octaprenyl-diphosphate synthase
MVELDAVKATESIDFNVIKNLTGEESKAVDKLIVDELSSDVLLINQMSHYIIGSGGKRLRPMLLLLAAKALGKVNESHLILAAVIEFIHTATLLHDDVVDESALRRNKETANEVWGNAASVLVGDFLYSRAFEMMVEPQKMQVMDIMAKTTNIIAQGEVLQLLNTQNLDLTETEYFTMIERKTACLFQASTHIGAILAKESDAKMLSNYGLYLGTAFQIVDDVLDYTSNNDTIGKTIGDDLREGKVTLPIIFALEKTNEENKIFLKQVLLSEEINEAQIKQTISILKEVDAFEMAIQSAKEFIEKAKKCLVHLEDSPYKEALIRLADLSINRVS